MRTVYVKKEPNGIRIQSFECSILIPEEEIDDVIKDLVELN